MTGTPHSRALRALPLMESGSDATTTLVLRLTEDIGRRPSDSASAHSCSRLMPRASPVKTMRSSGSRAKAPTGGLQA